MLGLQDILSNKQTRGAFGEIQLREIVTRALPPDAVELPGDALQRHAAPTA